MSQRRTEHGAYNITNSSSGTNSYNDNSPYPSPSITTTSNDNLNPNTRFFHIANIQDNWAAIAFW